MAFLSGSKNRGSATEAFTEGAGGGDARETVASMLRVKCGSAGARESSA